MLRIGTNPNAELSAGEPFMVNSNLLIVHQGALGDFVTIFPALTQLKQAYGRMDVLCQSQLGKLAQGLGLVERWYGLETACFATLYADRVDPKISEWLKPYSHILLFSFSSRLEKAFNQISGDRCLRLPPRPPAQEPIHITRYAFKNLINHGLLEHGENISQSALPVNQLVTARTHAWDHPKILIHPGAGSPRKRWPISSFLTVAARLKSDGLQVEFILGPAEQDLAIPLVAEMTSQDRNRSVHALTETLDLLALLRSAGGYIGNDSGVSHLAAFLGLPTTIVFGPADPNRWAPRGPAGSRIEVVRPELTCDPCFETEKVNCPDSACLTRTGPHDVLEAFCRVFTR
jgi:ADP-heptose:LPS heptosyltransferase